MTDAVEEFIEQWRVERPDLRLDAMASIGRLGRVMGLGTRVIETTLRRHDLRLSDFDVLATLRRLGPPYVATPSWVTQSLMLSPATLTSRLDRLENIGLIERRATRKIDVVCSWRSPSPVSPESTPPSPIMSRPRSRSSACCPRSSVGRSTTLSARCRRRSNPDQRQRVLPNRTRNDQSTRQALSRR